MRPLEREDDFIDRRMHLQAMSDRELHEHFWRLARQIVEPLLEEARTHTSPSIERSVLLRMGFSSDEAKALVKRFGKQGLLGHGAGHLVLKLAHSKNISVRQAGEALLAGDFWEELSQ